jgi:hypothetical protein
MFSLANIRTKKVMLTTLLYYWYIILETWCKINPQYVYVTPRH